MAVQVAPMAAPAQLAGKAPFDTTATGTAEQFVGAAAEAGHTRQSAGTSRTFNTTMNTDGARHIWLCETCPC